MVKQYYYQNVLYVVLKNQDLLKKQEASGTLSSLGLKIPLSHCKCNIKMNEIINKFLLVGDKFMPKMYLKQPTFTYSI